MEKGIRKDSQKDMQPKNAAQRIWMRIRLQYLKSLASVTGHGDPHRFVSAKAGSTLLYRAKFFSVLFGTDIFIPLSWSLKPPEVLKYAYYRKYLELK